VSATAVVASLGVASELATVPADRAKVLPVHDELVDLFPWGGLRRGSTVAVRGSTSLLLALLAEATGSGSWAAVVGLPNLGVLAAAECGVAADRLALVPRPGSQPAAVIAALLDGVDLVAVATELGDAAARRLSARARHRGAVLLSLVSWPAADLELTCEPGGWTGLGEGHGHLRHRQVRVHSRGRGAAARPARTTLLLPGPTGSPHPVLTPPHPLTEPREFPVPARRVPDSSPASPQLRAREGAV
jgi:hypothetical protein